MGGLRTGFWRRPLWLALMALVAAVSPARSTPSGDVARGTYLARITGCIGCHTPRTRDGVLEARLLSGGDHPIAGNLGRFFPPNITPDQATGLGAWTAADIGRAIKTGQTPDGRILSSAMPWRTQFSGLTDSDALAVAAYLKSLPPISNRVPPPLPPEKK
ncbi:cytochrome c [Methylovirgula ligni]|uniref:Cytochrome c n=1 Tax=Methylovirgula ligni TaxID=569860 RepID=A0A3D9YTB1_9HYPH|nr:cytochrome c [Methylovirgula ligni]REF85836.1 cytochrome c [Methylovirgula ligni]